MQKRHIIIGTSAAGIGVITKLRQLDPAAEIICISDEQEFPYNKCFLADYIAGIKSEQQLYTKSADYFNNQKIALMLNTRVTSIDAQNRVIQLADGQTIAYDKLFLGMGASPARLPQDNLRGIFYFHSLADIQALTRYCAQYAPKRAVVVGSGFTGLECADALSKKGIDVTVIEASAQLLGARVDSMGAQYIATALQRAQLACVTNERVACFQERNGQVVGLQCSSGLTIETDLVIIAIGVRPNVSLALQAGVTVNRGVGTNQYMQTTVPGIFAGGDLALVNDQATGMPVLSCTWPDAMLQGMSAAYAMAGDNSRPYAGVVSFANSHFFGHDFVTCGITHAGQEVVRSGDGYYHRYLMDNGTLQGFYMVGKIQNLPALRRAVLTKEKFNYDSL